VIIFADFDTSLAHSGGNIRHTTPYYAMAPSLESAVQEPDPIDMDAPLKAAPNLVAPEPGT
jgi:hypothetical protein